MAIYNSVLRDPKMRDPRGFILPADQPDFLTATKFVNTLIKAGVVVHRATAPFTVAGKQYPAGSYVVKAAQAFRAHVMDMFEPQDHPDDIPYPGGPPRPPYDVTGYNIAYSMGIKFDRILDGVRRPVREDCRTSSPPPPGNVAQAPQRRRLPAQPSGERRVRRREPAAEGERRGLLAEVAGDRERQDSTRPARCTSRRSRRRCRSCRSSRPTRGSSFDAVASKPAGDSMKLKPVRIGLWDQYGGSMPSGWTRWIFEQYEFPFEVVYPQTLDAGNLNAKFDVLVFVDGGIPERDAAAGGGGGFGGAQPAADTIPAEFRGWLGRVTRREDGARAEEVRRERRHDADDRIVDRARPSPRAADSQTRSSSGSPAAWSGRCRARSSTSRASILEARIDNTHPLAYGMDERAMVIWDESPAFRLQPEAALKGVKPVAWFDNADAAAQRLGVGPAVPRSGGRRSSTRRSARAASCCSGRRSLWRAQPHGTFKLFFNGIYYGSATSTAPAACEPTRRSRRVECGELVSW